MKLQWLALTLILFPLLLSGPLAKDSFAGAAFYVDAGGGYVQMKNTSQFYNNSSLGTNSGYGLNLGLWTTFTSGDPPIEFQFGLQDRYESVSASGDSYGLNLMYPTARLQLSRLFFSFGYTPFVMSSVGGSSAQNQTLSHVSGADAILGEVGTLLPVTPKFSFGVAFDYEKITSGGVSSPSPIYSGNFFMRFYFDFGGGGSRTSNEYHGWRYPFGKEIF
jgi:hypothetical protein